MVHIVIYSQWTLAKQRPGTQEMCYRTCESAGEKAIGLDRDKRKNREGREAQTNEPQSKTGVDPPNHPTRGFDGRMNPILPPLQPNWTNMLTHVFIYIEKATPEGETHTHS